MNDYLQQNKIYSFNSKLDLYLKIVEEGNAFFVNKNIILKTYSKLIAQILTLLNYK